VDALPIHELSVATFGTTGNM